MEQHVIEVSILKVDVLIGGIVSKYVILELLSWDQGDIGFANLGHEFCTRSHQEFTELHLHDCHSDISTSISWRIMAQSVASL